MIILVITAAALPDTSIGTGDFRAYWSASYLLATSQNFADPDLLWQVETEHTGWQETYPVFTWNPPWLLAMLLPYALFPFSQATWLWLFSNILFIFLGAVWAWQAGAQQDAVQRRAWVAPLLAFSFLPALLVLLMGQVSSLVFLGLAAFLYFNRLGRPLEAGAGLALTMVKPHLVYVTLPLLLLASVARGAWRLWAGFALLLLGLTAVVLVFKPDFWLAYSQTVSSGSLLDWQTPTLGGMLSASWGWQWSKLMGVVVLPAALLWWWPRFRRLDSETLVNVTLLLSVITAPFGWSYDVVVLLLPLLQVIIWLFEGRFDLGASFALVFLLLMVNILAFYQRSFISNEVDVFWLPLAIAGLYGLARLWRQGSHQWVGQAL